MNSNKYEQLIENDSDYGHSNNNDKQKNSKSFILFNCNKKNLNYYIN